MEPYLLWPILYYLQQKLPKECNLSSHGYIDLHLFNSQLSFEANVTLCHDLIAAQPCGRLLN